MKIIVYPHDLNMGGSQLNAIELGAAMRDLGHEVIIFGRPGSLVSYIDELGLEFIEAPAPGKRPSLRIARALRDLSHERGIDVIHGYEWPPALEAVYASRIGAKAVPVATVMSMAIPPFIPLRVPLAVGTEQIADFERQQGRTQVALIEPPVDSVSNAPDQAGDVAGFIRDHQLDADAIRLVVVTRLVPELKLEGILSAVRAMPAIDAATSSRVQLVIVGDGGARAQVEAESVKVNELLGRRAVVLTGQLADPRPAYAAADVMIGMGGSALRALAFAKPLIVQGENGFWRLLTPETLPEFLWGGWYGHGDGVELGEAAFASIADVIVSDAPLRAELGQFGRDLIEKRFALPNIARLQDEIYRRAVSDRPGGMRSAVADVQGLFRYAAYYVDKRVRRAMGREKTDDFNARPVAARTKG